MSKRSPMGYFTLDENPETIANKISNAFTGGRPTIKEQREKGGIPEKCPVYEIDVFHFVEDDNEITKTYHECKTGKLLCGEHKKRTIEYVLKFVKEHREKRKKCIDKAREILNAE
jgi:tryptophanyl-tRNA synthetase